MNAIHQEKTIISLIKSCTQKSHLLRLHSLLIRSSHFYNPTVFLSFLSRLSLPPFRDLSYSGRIFYHYPEPNVSLYNTMIKSHSLSRDSAGAGFLLYQELLRSGISSNALSATMAVKCCTKIESLCGGTQIHARIWKDGYLSDGLLMTTLMDFYSCLKKGVDACQVFDEMPHRDVVAWNVLISCCTRNGRTRDALSLFDMMRDSNGCRPDDVTCLLVLQACGSLNALEWGEKVHSYIVENGLLNAKSVCNSLISMYSRCGCVEKAYEVFKQMIYRDVVSWTAMISGLASNGYGRDAVEAFKQMQLEGILPGDQTFTAVLSACSHSGLVSEGHIFFNSMSRDFGVNPNIHHYGCMVDLLGRAGLLDEAYKLISSMKIKPDAAMWRTLLGACRIHRHVDLGELVVDHLVELKAQEAGDYVLLLNIYSSAGKSEKVIEVRKMMKEKGIQTTPASSSIELKGQVHEFFADDISHPRKKEIYEMLAEINQQLRIAGYVAEVTYELSYHSEKLAIAFGVLATPPGTTIRVAKDLRICVDCHNFCKILSEVYNRKVVIRDRNRFHHFREGRCSCNDYW
ncbi:pentatricopeptide repeat-containing protein at3g47530 [Phtheirospermum japonicum]|uniref:Pentatricopeptide repeat-containing protein at3g47530 n=1 Tax=Phtheirospermum japonicum TaxID=374723 RepID=A0A830BTV1_9LAMI|nr:pentatricopeptide repeat-containing protein at3g47530 [Phtheirospermum japonicum]